MIVRDSAVGLLIGATIVGAIAAATLPAASVALVARVLTRSNPR
ncbi:hypothetical protein [Parafrankia discariae]|nr:hypothetical protein [Parafrankia discariae]